MIKDTMLHPLARRLTEKFKDNIRSYLGVPVFYKNGEMFGTLCAVDSKPTNFTEKDLKTIERFSHLFSYVVELERRANHDILTGLYSSSYLYDNFDSLEDKGILMSLDLDGFKQVNDQYGHEAGDEVLKEVGRRIKRRLPTGAVGVRLGGDEFILFFPHKAAKKQAVEKAESILYALSDWKGFKYDIDVSASIGIVQIPEDGRDLETLLRKADQAMYYTKRNGKHFYSFYRA